MNLVHLDIKPDNIFISLPEEEEATVPTECNVLIFDGLKAQYKIGNGQSTNNTYWYYMYMYLRIIILNNVFSAFTYFRTPTGFYPVGGRGGSFPPKSSSFPPLMLLAVNLILL